MRYDFFDGTGDTQINVDENKKMNNENVHSMDCVQASGLN